jgi:putative hydrolase of the HAD superfamily
VTAQQSIEVILFDMGGTLEHVYFDEETRLRAAAGLTQILSNAGIPPSLAIPQLRDRVHDGLQRYKTQQTVANRELPPERIWADYLLAGLGLPTDRVEGLADELSDFFETGFFRRGLRDGVHGVLNKLQHQGFRIGMVSNTISRNQVPELLIQYGIRDYFDPVVLSAVYGWRKPDPRIFLHAARLADARPRACAYVGDTISRDVLGARRAGFGLVVQIPSFLSPLVDKGDEGVKPDACISQLPELLDLMDG